MTRDVWWYVLSLVWLLVLVFVLYGLALYLAHGNRRKTLAHIGWGLVIVGLLVLVARRILGNYIVNGLTQPENRLPAHHIWLFATEILGQIGYATVLYGVVAVLGAFVAGPTRPATAMRSAKARRLLGANTTIFAGRQPFTIRAGRRRSSRTIRSG